LETQLGIKEIWTTQTIAWEEFSDLTTELKNSKLSWPSNQTWWRRNRLRRPRLTIFLTQPNQFMKLWSKAPASKLRWQRIKWKKCLTTTKTISQSMKPSDFLKSKS
jgi:hypothetical protein